MDFCLLSLLVVCCLGIARGTISPYATGRLGLSGVPGVSNYGIGAYGPGTGSVGNVIVGGGSPISAGLTGAYGPGVAGIGAYGPGTGSVGNVIVGGGSPISAGLTGAYGPGVAGVGWNSAPVGYTAFAPGPVGVSGIGPVGYNTGYTSGLSGFYPGSYGGGNFGSVMSPTYFGGASGVSGTAVGGSASATATLGSTATAFGGTAMTGPGVGPMAASGIGTGYTSGGLNLGIGNSYGPGFYGGGAGRRGYNQCYQVRSYSCPYGTRYMGQCGGKTKKCKICCSVMNICQSKGKKGPRYYYC